MSESKLEAAVHDLFDELLPEKFDWEGIVREYPLPAVAVAALGGFLLGRSHGPAVLAAISSFAAAEVAKNVSSLIGEEID